ncbi:ATP-binding protein [Treponema sp. OMZ 788]|uniref:AAA family ATPase n=1 Tax=Treponema sp. OMZ 788 TaxID=2563664 RepID=UPI0020A48284|nr:ATP-binding protein [Treponema sp. OMZ 788]UTC64125.1 ATP-binding protein [Treponema sp. OMZ 788]
MILEFSIANTFSISEKQTISFEAVINDTETDARHYVECGGKKILKLACIYGANAAGKTKMLEALQFYMSFLLSSFNKLKPDEKIGVVPFKFDPHFQNQPSEFDLIFYIKDTETAQYIRYEYNLQLTTEKVLYESLFYAPKGQKKRIFERSENNKIKWGSDITGAKKILEDMTRPNCSVISTGAQIEHLILNKIYRYFILNFTGLYVDNNGFMMRNALMLVKKNNNFKNKLIQLLSAADMTTIKNIEVKEIPISEELFIQLPKDIQERVSVSNNGYILEDIVLTHCYNGINYILSFSQESAGTVKMIGMSTILFLIVQLNYIFTFDELESSLHQELIELFLDLFLEISDHSQLLFTTHNQDLLDSGLLRDDEVWFCYKTQEGNSVYNSITDYKGIRKETSRKKLYNADTFGALPNININLLKELFYAEKNRKNTK